MIATGRGMAFILHLAYIQAYAGWFQAVGGEKMSARRHVKLFRNGRNQAVRIPREFELPGTDAVLSKDGDRLIIEPAGKKSLSEIIAGWEPIPDEFPTIEDPPPEPVEI